MILSYDGMSPEEIHNEKLRMAEAECLAYNRRTGRFSSCPTCKGKGYIMIIRERDGYCYTPLTPCPDCRNKTDSERMMASLGADTEMTFDTYKVDTAWQRQIKASAQAFNERWFFVGGQTGCGKTHICTALLKVFYEQQFSVEVFRWVDDGKRLKALSNDSEYSARIDKYKRCDVLYIDDLFKGAVTDADIKLAYEILDFRYRNKSKTIISSEWFTKEIADFDASISGRIEEMSKGHCHNITRDDVRNWRNR